VALAGFMLPAVARSQEPAPVSEPSANPQTAPSSPSDGTLIVQVLGNRKFCVKRNELDVAESSTKPEGQHHTPSITTMGYKYQISVSRRGDPGITKLLESPVIRTLYWESKKKEQGLPQPRLPDENDLKKAESGQTYTTHKTAKWIAENACTTLLPEYGFPLAPGRYDVYLGFDLLGVNGQWVPLLSDFITNLSIETGKKAQVVAQVDSAGPRRTVKLEAPDKTATASGR